MHPHRANLLPRSPRATVDDTDLQRFRAQAEETARRQATIQEWIDAADARSEEGDGGDVTGAVLPVMGGPRG